MTKPTGRAVRDPVWNNVRLDAAAAEVIDTPQFQRLRRVKQLGFAHLVYPGATHTRFAQTPRAGSVCARRHAVLVAAALPPASDAGTWHPCLRGWPVVTRD